MRSSNDASAPSKLAPSASRRFTSADRARASMTPSRPRPGGTPPAAELAHDEPRLIADDGRVDVLVRVADAHRGGAVDAALVGEGARADVRCVGVRRGSGELGHEAREGPELAQVAARDGGHADL